MNNESCLKEFEKCHIQPIECPKCKNEVKKFYKEYLDKLGNKIENGLMGLLKCEN